MCIDELTLEDSSIL